MNHTQLHWIDDELRDLENAGLCRQLATRTSPQSATITIDGRELNNFGSNDYLGLAAECLNDTIIEAIRTHGWVALLKGLKCVALALPVWTCETTSDRQLHGTSHGMLLAVGVPLQRMALCTR